MQIYLVDFCSLEELMENNTGSEWTQVMQSHRLRFLVLSVALDASREAAPCCVYLLNDKDVPVFQCFSSHFYSDFSGYTS